MTFDTKGSRLLGRSRSAKKPRHARLQAVDRSDLVWREGAVEDRQLVEQPDVAEAEADERLLRVPREGLLPGAENAARLAVEIQACDAVRLAGIEALEGEDDVRPRGAGERAVRPP
jgi:hypothetical protein